MGALVGAAITWAVVARPAGSPEASDPPASPGSANSPNSPGIAPPLPELPPTTSPGIVASGRLGDGTMWAIAARRVGPAVCSRLIVPGISLSPEEDCEGPGPPQNAFGSIRSRSAREDPARPALTWGTVSLATEVVRVSTAGGVVGETNTVGQGSGVGVRFFVLLVPRNVPATVVALGAHCQELSRVELPAVPPR
jgi:hypothetical protein